MPTTTKTEYLVLFPRRFSNEYTVLSYDPSDIIARGFIAEIREKALGESNVYLRPAQHGDDYRNAIALMDTMLDLNAPSVPASLWPEGFDAARPDWDALRAKYTAREAQTH